MLDSGLYEQLHKALWVQKKLSETVARHWVTTEYQGLTLSSHFQPIFSISHRRPVGYEGLLRASTDSGALIPPPAVLVLPNNSKENLELDRACRQLHLQNFARQETGDCWLFLNLNSQCLVTEQPDAGFMNRLFETTGIHPSRLVIEILESEITDRSYLKQLIKHFRSLGCLIAIDDFGAGHSNFDRIWELEPDIVKIDRSLVQEAGKSSRVERILTGIVSLIHEAGSLVVLEGVETRREALVSIAANADMVQGFYFAKPQQLISSNHEEFVSVIDELLQHQQRQRFKNTHQINENFRKIERLFKRAINHFSVTQNFEESSEILFAEKRSVRCYLLDDAGYQMARNIYSPHYQQTMDVRFTPLLSGDNANWSHKHYHFRAVQHPGQMQLSRPYLSVADSRMCITVSQTVTSSDKQFVFCCDLDWQDN
ncbi:hypothetical protein MPL1_10542 [Methylophaga lonarensis MPL]|uniref:EAL domain-containing protein n=1 Tax=Methylophaga lonarensis MPL TaxID=1286106 RepID=M7NYT5_9GAMM|nr:EAL domain-containing protein [Methylophaga lonarensis]EMR12366.1 hypothetical protein MPL1_10542 [Methylophaga lonarensis MPL]